MPRLAAAVAILLVLAAAAVPVPAAPPLVTVEGVIPFPDRGRTSDGAEVTITGLSGVTWLGGDAFVAVMDNSDCLVRFTLALTALGGPQAVGDVRIVRLDAVHDYEDVAVCPEPLRRRIARRRGAVGEADPGPCLLVCEEDTPAIRGVALESGRLLGLVPLPDLLRDRRPNRGLEAVAVDPDGSRIWTASEEALVRDGPASAADAGTVVRLVGIAVPEGPEAGRDVVQHAYAVAPPHAFVRVFAGEPLAGVVALVPLGAGRLLVLERSAGPGLPPFTSRLTLVDTRAAADVSGVDRALAGRPELHVARDVVWEESLGCNLEGLCLGPALAAGRRSLVGVADNGGLGTPNQLVGLSVATLPLTSP